AVPFIERQRIERHVAGRAVELEGLDDALRRGIAVEHAVEAVLAAILVPLDEAPRPAVADVVANDRRGQPAWPDPLGEELGIGVRAVDELTRGGELAGHVDER